MGKGIYSKNVDIQFLFRGRIEEISWMSKQPRFLCTVALNGANEVLAVTLHRTRCYLTQLKHKTRFRITI